jgi:hypothetical protein
MNSLPWILLALAMLPCGWFASAWYHGRKLYALRSQLEAMRRVSAEHMQQMRHQIGLLQAELAARPPMPLDERERRAQAAEAALAAAAGSAAAVPREGGLPADGFAPTAVLPHGFAKTEVMADRVRGARPA